MSWKARSGDGILRQVRGSKRSQPAVSWASRVARAHARVSVAGHRALQASDGLVAGILDGALTTEQKTELGVALYDSAPHYRAAGELFDWEDRWFAERLPPAPARVLVGACGSGREVLALLAAGYEVHGFEPAGSLLALARGRAGEATLWQDSYETWLERKDEPDYDAVLLGWGSISHVLEATTRRALIRQAAQVCPTGPILLSYWARSTSPGAARARKIGARLGARLGAGPALGDAYRPNIGFVHMFSRAELGDLGASAGRSICVEGEPSDYPHATLLP